MSKPPQETFRSTAARLVCGCLLSLLLQPTAAHALIVNNNVQGTLVNPANYAPWTQGDPGWENVGSGNLIYLGDSWVLTARHKVDPTPSNPATVTFSTGTFQSIPNQSYVVHNPPPALAAGLSLTTETDLRLIRIDGDPGLPPLTILTQTPPAAGSNGSEMVFVSHGLMQEASKTNWNVNTSNPDDWSWSETPSGGNYHGYKTTGSVMKRWGTNKLANAQSSDYNEVFSHRINSRTAIMPLKTPDGFTRDVITMLSTFDNGSTSYETQAISRDSGGAVFYKSGSQWQLAGIVNSALLYSNQPAATGVYGDATTFSNLWYYNQNYSGSISNIIGAQQGYSIMGDVNLDGIVTGNGKGSAAVDDVTAFVQGWSHQQAAGDINSWKKGDLNLDGRTDIDDFLLFRGTVAGTASGSALTTLFGGASGVPEPATIALLILGSLGVFSTYRLPRRGSGR